tara:strand:+ start:144 stop:278 length:135 start_codon:yes stop_codon:yes gene_type:complete
MFTKKEQQYINELLTSSCEWDDNPPTEMINSISKKIILFTDKEE